MRGEKVGLRLGKGSCHRLWQCTTDGILGSPGALISLVYTCDALRNEGRLRFSLLHTAQKVSDWLAESPGSSQPALAPRGSPDPAKPSSVPSLLRYTAPQFEGSVLLSLSLPQRCPKPPCLQGDPTDSLSHAQSAGPGAEHTGRQQLSVPAHVGTHLSSCSSPVPASVRAAVCSCRQAMLLPALGAQLLILRLRSSRLACAPALKPRRLRPPQCQRPCPRCTQNPPPGLLLLCPGAC